jgi:hypothetical protein
VAPAPAVVRAIAINGNLDFGNITIGSTASRTLTISNTGGAPLEVNDVAVPNGFTRNWIGGVIPPNSSQPVIVTFAPTAAVAYGGTVTVTSNATSGTSTAPISGVGIAATTKVISLSGNLAFGNVPVGSSATRTLTVRNLGSGTLTVTGLAASGGMNSVLAANWLSGTIAPGGAQDILIQFAPSSAQGYAGTLTVLSDATSGENSTPVSGTGTSIPPVTVPGYYVWGGQNYTQYLGFFTCLYCVEYHAESINNQFGVYGSRFSSTSIRNRFSQYGSPFSTNSACNRFASNPPRVYNSNRSVYYGELTLNEFRTEAIKAATIVTWLSSSVCAD